MYGSAAKTISTTVSKVLTALPPLDHDTNQSHHKKPTNSINSTPRTIEPTNQA